MISSRFISSAIILTLLLGLVALLSLISFSPLELSLHDLKPLFTETSDLPLHALVIEQLRLPRVAAGFLCGAALATAGTLMQATTANPLASPSLFGINAGAMLGLVIATALPLPANWPSDYLLSALSAACCWALVMGFSGHGERLRLILTGIAVSTFCAALSRALLLFFDDSSQSLLSQMAGNLTGLRWPAVEQMALIILPLLVLSLFIAPRLNILALGNAQSHTLGLNTVHWRWGTSIIVLLLVCASVVEAGTFTFLGLLVPHLARLLVGHDYRRLLPIALLIGALLLGTADLLGRAVNFPAETPAGAILALIGAPFFVYLVRRQ